MITIHSMYVSPHQQNGMLNQGFSKSNHPSMHSPSCAPSLQSPQQGYKQAQYLQPQLQPQQVGSGPNQNQGQVQQQSNNVSTSCGLSDTCVSATYKCIVESLVTIVSLYTIDVNTGAELVYGNPAFCARFSRKQQVPSTLLQLVHENDQVEVLRAIYRLQENNSCNPQITARMINKQIQIGKDDELYSGVEPTNNGTSSNIDAYSPVELSFQVSSISGFMVVLCRPSLTSNQVLKTVSKTNRGGIATLSRAGFVVKVDNFTNNVGIKS